MDSAGAADLSRDVLELQASLEWVTPGCSNARRSAQISVNSNRSDFMDNLERGARGQTTTCDVTRSADRAGIVPAQWRLTVFALSHGSNCREPSPLALCKRA